MSLPNFVLPEEGYTFDWPVKVWVPINGTKKAFTFTATFKHVSPERRLEILEKFREINLARNKALLDVSGDDGEDDAILDGTDEREHLTFEQDLLEEVMAGWDMKDKNGELVEFNQQSLRGLLKFDPARAGALESYQTALNGRAPEKNSLGRRKPGQKR